MGTTVTAVLLAGDRVALLHVGDSRAYLLAAGAPEMVRLTRDDTYVQSLVDQGALTAGGGARPPAAVDDHPGGEGRAVPAVGRGDPGRGRRPGAAVQRRAVRLRRRRGDRRDRSRPRPTRDLCAACSSSGRWRCRRTDNVTAVVGDVVALTG